jgi:hypothetical protein
VPTRDRPQGHDRVDRDRTSYELWWRPTRLIAEKQRRYGSRSKPISSAGEQTQCSAETLST